MAAFNIAEFLRRLLTSDKAAEDIAASHLVGNIHVSEPLRG